MLFFYFILISERSGVWSAEIRCCMTMRQILSLWRGLLYRLHCFRLSNVLPKLQFDNWVIWVITAVITICACSVAAGFVALRWFIMRHTIANRITGCLLFLLPFANMLFSGKEHRHWLQLLFAMPVPVSLLWQQRFGKRWWPSWRLPEIQTGMQAAVDA